MLQRIVIAINEQILQELLYNFVKSKLPNAEVIKTTLLGLNVCHLNNENMGHLLICPDWIGKNYPTIINQFHLNYPNVKIIVLTLWDQPYYLAYLKALGVIPFLLTQQKLENLVQILNSKDQFVYTINPNKIIRLG